MRSYRFPVVLAAAVMMTAGTLSAATAKAAATEVAGMPATSASAPATAAGQIVPAADRDVSFMVDGTTTYGTIHVPAHRRGQRLAAALLLPGSGSTDRNGDDPALGLEPQTLKLIAGILGSQGIMTLRFDKYGTGQTGLGAFAEDPARLGFNAQIRQADAAYGLLRDQPEADPHAMLIVGHSGGGFTALLVDASVRPHPAGLALLAPQDERILNLVSLQLGEQLDAGVAAGQITAAVAAQNKTGIDRVISQFRARKPVDTSGLLPQVANLLTQGIFPPDNVRFVRQDDAIYPPAAAARLPHGTRVLVTCGTADPNVPCSTTPGLLDALAAAHATGPGLRVLQDIGHFLQPTRTPVNDAIIRRRQWLPSSSSPRRMPATPSGP